MQTIQEQTSFALPKRPATEIGFLSLFILFGLLRACCCARGSSAHFIIPSLNKMGKLFIFTHRGDGFSQYLSLLRHDSYVARHKTLRNKVFCIFHRASQKLVNIRGSLLNNWLFQISRAVKCPNQMSKCNVALIT